MDIQFGNFSYAEKVTCTECWFGRADGKNVTFELWYPAYYPTVSYHLTFGDDFGGDLSKVNFDSFIFGTASAGICGAYYPCSASRGGITQAVLPEPATWALMIGGLALVGASMRHRRMAVSFA